MLVVTPNTCIDVTTWLPTLVPGSVSRATRTEVTPGGKGVNVCRTLRALGTTPRLIGLSPLSDPAARGAPRRGGLRLPARPPPRADPPGAHPPRGRRPGHRRQRPRARSRRSGSRPSCSARSPTRSRAHPPRRPSSARARSPRTSPSRSTPTSSSRPTRRGVLALVDAAPAVLGASLTSGPDLVSPNLGEVESLSVGSHRRARRRAGRRRRRPRRHGIPRAARPWRPTRRRHRRLARCRPEHPARHVVGRRRAASTSSTPSARATPSSPAPPTPSRAARPTSTPCATAWRSPPPPSSTSRAACSTPRSSTGCSAGCRQGCPHERAHHLRRRPRVGLLDQDRVTGHERGERRAARDGRPRRGHHQAPRLPPQPRRAPPRWRPALDDRPRRRLAQRPLLRRGHRGRRAPAGRDGHGRPRRLDGDGPRAVPAPRSSGSCGAGSPA